MSESRILEALDQGVRRAGRLFAAVSAREEARFMGDASFFRWLDGLAFAPEPLVAGLPAPFPKSANGGDDDPQADLYLGADIRPTAFGAEVFAGRSDHAHANPVDRWLGGTHLTNDCLWRWNRTTGSLVAPA